MEIKDLENYGFNVAEGLELCADDEDIYKEVLETALEEGMEKVPFMDELMANKDFERYTIEAHGLKNAAKQIGCDKLSEMAKTAEFAGKAGDTQALVDGHEALMDEYRKVNAVITRLFS